LKKTKTIKKKEFSVYARRHTQHSNLVMLVPDGLNSPLEFEFIQQAQFLVVDEENNWNPVCMSYKK